jgi:hypothetical protein
MMENFHLELTAVMQFKMTFMCICPQEKSRWLVTNGCVLQQPRSTVLIDEPHIPLAHLEDTLEGEYATYVVCVSVRRFWTCGLFTAVGTHILVNVMLYRHTRFNANGKVTFVHLSTAECCLLRCNAV